MPDEIVAKELAQDTSSGTISRLAHGQKKWRAQAKKLVGERDAIKAELTQAKLDLVAAKANDGAVAELNTLKAQVKLDKHRAVFDRLAKAAGCKDKALDDLWEKSGYNTPGDVPDEKAIAKAIETQKVEREYMFGDVPAETTDAPVGFIDGPPEPGEQHIVKPAAGRGQGGTQRATGSQTQITDAQLRDPIWCRANQAKLAAVAQTVSGMSKSEVGSKLAILG